MSLNREQWIKMWDNIKEMEAIITFASELTLIKRRRLLNKIELMKKDVESVIGQME
jgi:hypothetical protein